MNPIEMVTEKKKKMNLLKMVNLFGKSKDDENKQWEERRVPTSEMADMDDNASVYSAVSVRSTRSNRSMRSTRSNRGHKKKGWFGRRKKESLK
jgi:hypothetical protein